MSAKHEFLEAASPIMRLLGHSLAVALGFCGFAVISLIPVGMLWMLAWMGVGRFTDHLNGLVALVLVADGCLFTLVFLSGVVVFAVETLARTRATIVRWLKDSANG